MQTLFNLLQTNFMKKKFITVATIALASTMLFSSCIGPFNLSKKLLTWNQTIDSKFVNELVFIILSPAYLVTFMADVLVLNSIEFWTGENPIQAGIVKQVQGENGVYTVETMEDGYKILNEEGQQTNLVYDKDSNTWSAVANGITTKLITIGENNDAIVYLPNGEEKQVELSNEGILDLRQSVESSMFFAAK